MGLQHTNSLSDRGFCQKAGSSFINTACVLILSVLYCLWATFTVTLSFSGAEREVELIPVSSGRGATAADVRAALVLADSGGVCVKERTLWGVWLHPFVPLLFLLFTAYLAYWLSQSLYGEGRSEYQQLVRSAGTQEKVKVRQRVKCRSAGTAH